MEFSVKASDSPYGMAEWSTLAELKSYYVQPRWLTYADADGLSASRYWGAIFNTTLAAAVPSHWSSRETNRNYQISKFIQIEEDRWNIDEPTVLTIGGRRGYLSEILRHPDLDDSVVVDALALVLREIHGHSRYGRWWWPYLTTSDVEIAVKAYAALLPDMRPDVRPLAADCIIELVGECLGDHVGDLGAKQRRTNARREQKAFQESPLRVVQLDLRECWRDLAPLLTNVQQKYGDPRPVSEHARFFELQKQHLAEDSIVFGCFDRRELVGYSLSCVTPREMTVRSVGFKYDSLLGVGEYAELAIYAPLRHCYEKGIPRLHLGKGSYAAKVRRGAVLRPLWALTMPNSNGPAIKEVPPVLESMHLPSHEGAQLKSTFVADIEKLADIKATSFAS